MGNIASTSFTITESPPTVSEQLSEIGEQLVIVWDYAGGQWLFHDPNDPLGSDLVALVEGMGYWIKVSEDCTVVYLGQEWDLVSGWNLIGWMERGQDMSAAELSQVLPPGLPCRFYGNVVADSGPVPDGTVVKAVIEGVVVGNTTIPAIYGPSTYAIKITPSGGEDYGNETVTFRIGSRTAQESAVWAAGGNLRLDLTAGEAPPPLQAETAIAAEVSGGGMVVLPASILRVKDPGSGEPVPVLIDHCEVRATYDPACIQMLSGGNLSRDMGGIAPPVSAATFTPRLVGCTFDECELAVSLDLILDSEGREIQQEAPQHLLFRRGDIGGDGDVDIVDAMFGAQYLVGLRPVSDIQPLNMASVHHDDGGDMMNVVDCMYIAQYVVGDRDCFFERVP